MDSVRSRYDDLLERYDSLLLRQDVLCGEQHHVREQLSACEYDMWLVEEPLNALRASLPKLIFQAKRYERAYNRLLAMQDDLPKRLSDIESHLALPDLDEKKKVSLKRLHARTLREREEISANLKETEKMMESLLSEIANVHTEIKQKTAQLTALRKQYTRLRRQVEALHSTDEASRTIFMERLALEQRITGLLMSHHEELGGDLVETWWRRLSQ